MDGESKYRNICGNYAYILCFKRFLNFFEKSACNLKKAVVLLLSRRERRQNKIVGVDCREGPPVPIPNTEVKLAGAEDTWLVTAWENRIFANTENHLQMQVAFLILPVTGYSNFSPDFQQAYFLIFRQIFLRLFP